MKWNSLEQVEVFVDVVKDWTNTIDVDASSTRHEELLFDRKQLQMVWKLRRVLSGLAADGNAAPGLELLVDRLRTFRTNDEFLNEIGKQPTM